MGRRTEEGSVYSGRGVESSRDGVGELVIDAVRVIIWVSDALGLVAEGPDEAYTNDGGGEDDEDGDKGLAAGHGSCDGVVAETSA